MDNKQFPEQEGPGIPPEEPSGIPDEREPLEERPLIEELLFSEADPETDTPSTAEEISAAEDTFALDRTPIAEELSPAEGIFALDETSMAEQTPAAENIPVAQTDPVPEETPAGEAVPAGNERSFMERIPDVEEDYPDEEAGGAPGRDLLTAPEVGQEITPDSRAMDFHGMLGHDEEEPPFDMSILDDPEFALPEEPEPPKDDVNDQEYRDNGKEFDAMFDTPAAEDPVPTHQRPTRKGRPKRKKGEGLLGIPHILVTFVWLALILAIGVTLGRMLWICAADVLAFGREDKSVTITIYESDTMEDITNKLYDAGLIRYKSLFNLYASISDAEEDIQPGIYDLNTRYDYHALVNFMTPRSSREVISLTIPEGYTCRQIFDLLEEKKICTVVDVAAYAASGELDEYWFLEDVARGDPYCLEGFLFPDTYEFYKNSTPKEALEKMLDNFNVRFSEEMRAQIDTLNANVTGGGYTVREVTIVASLIEKESAAPAESPKIAGVIYNRLFRWGDTPAYLNIDAALVYAQNGANDTIDTGIVSPYNTYTNTGLTPTPIANPGLSSLQAALEPESHDYYYYVLNPSTGMHQFSTTYEEHEAWRAEFAAASGD